VTDHTAYFADFELTTLVRTVSTANGRNGREPLWFQGGNEQGLAIFASALDAEIYRQFAILNGSSGWERIPLARFALAELINAAGGRLSCQLTFGFSATVSGELDTRGEGLPRPLLVPVLFEVQSETSTAITFQFQSWIFEFIRKQWAVIGPENYAAQVESMNTASDAELAALAKYATKGVSSRKTSAEAHDWCLYAPEGRAWHFGPTELRQVGHLH
jgi:hypothetical protein